jgi:hypothetical protein
MTKILLKTIVREYYRQNIMFFAVIFFVAGSFMRATEHIQLAKLAVSTPQFLMYVMVLWGVYTIKVTLFGNRIIKERPYEILYQGRIFPKFKRIFALSILQFNLLGLSIGYSFFYIYIGVQMQAWLSVGLIIIFDLLMILIGVIVYEYRLRNPNPVKTFNGLNLKIVTPNYLFFIRYLIIKQPILLILTKVFTIFWVLGTILLFPTDDYDERLLSLGGLFAALGHVAICQRYFEFEFQFLSFNRNLPISSFKRFINYSINFLLILLPEIFVLIRNFPDSIHPIYIIQLILFILSIILLAFCTLFINLPEEVAGKRLFWVSVLFFLSIMFKIPIWALAFINFGLSFYLLKKHFYQAEYIIRKS